MVVVTFLFLRMNLWAHGGKDHSKENKQKTSVKKLKDKYTVVNKAYIQKVKPIFKRSCFDCHGNTTKYPWYYKIPGIKQLIDSDISEAKVHLDFSNDFPFKSHETPLKDLNAILKAVKDESMPPFRYRILHGDSKLSKKEIKEIENWIKNSKEILR